MRRIWVGHYRRPACAEDARFLRADAFASRAEVVDVIDIDGRDDGDIGVDNVDSIEPAPEPDLDHQRVEPGMREQP